jgi:hypothetical protein
LPAKRGGPGSRCALHLVARSSALPNRAVAAPVREAQVPAAASGFLPRVREVLRSRWRP